MQDDWKLRDAVSADIDELMAWFPRHEDVLIWGGPTFRYPFTRATFFEDVNRGQPKSFSLCDAAGKLAAFGQVFERLGRIHIARLVVHPAMRRRGVGKRLVDMLMVEGRRLYDCDEYSLFVFRDNVAAFECYRTMGFVVRDYPEGVPHADVCYFLTRPVVRPQQE